MLARNRPSKLPSALARKFMPGSAGPCSPQPSGLRLESSAGRVTARSTGLGGAVQGWVAAVSRDSCGQASEQASAWTYSRTDLAAALGRLMTISVACRRGGVRRHREVAARPLRSRRGLQMRCRCRDKRPVLMSRTALASVWVRR